MAIIFTAPLVETGFAGDMDMKLPNVENTVVEGVLMNETAGVEGIIEPNVSN